VTVDPYEFYRLQDENEYLREQVRTFAAELAGKRSAEWITLAFNGDRHMRPASRTAAARQLISDEVIALGMADVKALALDEMMRQIDELAGLSRPLDRLWRITVERDYIA
jgi:hypothetical protein